MSAIQGYEPIVAKLRSKPGGDRVSVTMGDFADVGVTGTYELIYVVFNSFFNLLTQDDQVRCFENVAAHLSPGGAFVIEGGCTFAFVNDLSTGQYVRAEHVSLTADGIRFVPVAQRVRMAERARPHGPHRRPPAPRAVGHVDARGVHGVERQRHLGLRTLTLRSDPAIRERAAVC